MVELDLDRRLSFGEGDLERLPFAEGDRTASLSSGGEGLLLLRLPFPFGDGDLLLESKILLLASSAESDLLLLRPLPPPPLPSRLLALSPRSVSKILACVFPGRSLWWLKSPSLEPLRLLLLPDPLLEWEFNKHL